MARTAANVNYFNFTKGLVTEASPLTYPEGASLDEDNMDLKANGSRVRRLGMDYEIGNSILGTSISESDTQAFAYDTFEWRGVSGITDKNVVIYQRGDLLYIHDLDINAVSSTVNPAITLSTHKVAAATTAQLQAAPVDITYGNGVAYVVSSAIEPFFIKYTTSTGLYTTHTYPKQIRDFEGVGDGLDIFERIILSPATIARLAVVNNAHLYNIRNQGWGNNDRLLTDFANYITAKNVSPSNADIYTFGKDATETFDATLLDKIWFGNTHAPRGYFLLNPYNQVRDSSMQYPGGGFVGGVVSTRSTNSRPTTCAYYTGRLFTAGISDDNLAGTILFSRIIEDPLIDAGLYYQRADPTSETINALQPDDGGVIKLPESGAIHRLIPLGNGLAVVAQNGIWIIQGAVDFGFAADSFSVQKITSVGCDAPKGVVEVEGALVYVSRSGLYALGPNQSGSGLSAQNITMDTIQSEFHSIPYTRLQKSKLIYDPIEREIKFYYTTDSASPFQYRYDRIITLDTRLKAFYKTSISGVEGVANQPHVTAPFVTLNINATGTYESGVRHFCEVPTAGNYLYSVSITHDNSFLDWNTHGGIDYTSFVETGYQIFDDAMRNKQVDWLVTFMERTELTHTAGIPDNESSCLMQIKFDWTDSTSASKWTTPTEIYVYVTPYLIDLAVPEIDYGYDVLTKKEKIRGTGRAIRIRYSSSTGKDMRILGWAITTSGNTVV